MSLQRRFQEADVAYRRLTRQQERDLISAYQDSLSEIRLLLSIAYEKHGGSYSEMMKYRRLEKLEKDIGEEIRLLTGKNAQNLKKGIGMAYEDSYYRAAYAIEREAQARLGYSMLNRRAIEANIENPLDRIGWPQRNRDNQALMVRQIREELTRGLIQGKAYQDTARRIKERMDVGATKAVTIARTESHRAYNAGRLDSMKHAESKGIEMRKKWVSTLDDRTRPDHQDMDDVTVGIDEQFEIDGDYGDAPGVGFADPENVINCRCTFITEIVGYAPEVRRSRGEGIIPYTTYNEWKENRIDA